MGVFYYPNLIITVVFVVAIIAANKKVKQRKNIAFINDENVAGDTEQNPLKYFLILGALIFLNMLFGVFGYLFSYYIMARLYILHLVGVFALNLFIIYTLYITLKKNITTTSFILPMCLYSAWLFAMTSVPVITIILLVLFVFSFIVQVILLKVSNKKAIQKDITTNLFADEEEE